MPDIITNPTMSELRQMHRSYLEPFYKKAVDKALAEAAARRSKHNQVLEDQEIARIRIRAREEVRERKDVMSLREYAAKSGFTSVIEAAHANANPKKVRRAKTWKTNRQRKGKDRGAKKKTPLQEMMENN